MTPAAAAVPASAQPDGSRRRRARQRRRKRQQPIRRRLKHRQPPLRSLHPRRPLRLPRPLRRLHGLRPLRRLRSLHPLRAAAIPKTVAASRPRLQPSPRPHPRPRPVNPPLPLASCRAQNRHGLRRQPPDSRTRQRCFFECAGAPEICSPLPRAAVDRCARQRHGLLGRAERRARADVDVSRAGGRRDGEHDRRLAGTDLFGEATIRSTCEW